MMLRQTLTLLAMLSAAAPAPAQETPGPVEVVESLFRHMKDADAEAMRALLHPEARLVTTQVRDGIPIVRVVGVEGWLQNVGTGTRELDERLYDTVVHQEGGLAKVWTRYDLFVGGIHSHCGVDDIVLVLTGEGWRIIHIADTRSTQGCRGS